jgi:hypothetical protein
VLNLAQPLSTRPNCLPLCSSEGGQGRGVPQGVAPSRVPAQRAALLAPAAALLGPSAPALTLNLASIPPMLHANTHLHANDRQGLERLCRYGARGALALERLSRAEDGRIAYRMKRPLPDGTTHLLFTGLEFLRRVASLVPPPRANLTRFHGVFAPGAHLRPFLVPQAGEEEASVALEAAASKEPMKERPSGVDWAEVLRRTFDFDVFAQQAQAPCSPELPLLAGRPGPTCASRRPHPACTGMAHFSWAPVSCLPPPLCPNPLPSTVPLFLLCANVLRYSVESLDDIYLKGVASGTSLHRVE